MAKAKKEPKTTGGASTLLQRLKATSKIAESGVFSDSELYTKQMSIETPIPIINLALSGKFFGGGITKGSTAFAGESKTFKTNCALLCMQSYLETYEDAVGVVYDSEFSITPAYLKTFGIDPSRVFITPITDLDLLKNDLVNQIDQIQESENVFILVDSIGNLASLKEISDAQEGKSTIDMTRAKMIKALFRMITPRVNLKGIPFFSIQHSYKTQEIYSKTVVSGGTGIMYSSNTVIIFSRRNLDGKKELGSEYVMTIEKSRFVKEGMRLPLAIPSSGKIRKWSGLYDLAVEYGFIKSGAWVEVPCLVDYEGKKVRRADIEDNDEFWGKIFSETDFAKTVEDDIAVSQDQSGLFSDIDEEAGNLFGDTEEDTYIEETNSEINEN